MKNLQDQSSLYLWVVVSIKVLLQKPPWHCLLFQLGRFILQLCFIDGPSRVRGDSTRDEKQAYITISRKLFTCIKQNFSKSKGCAILTNMHVSIVVLKAGLPQTYKYPSNQNRGFCAGKGQNLGWYGPWWSREQGILSFRLESHPVANLGQSPCREALEL